MGRVSRVWSIDGELVLLERCRRRDVLAAWLSTSPRPPLRIFASAIAHPGYDVMRDRDEPPPDVGDREPRTPHLPGNAGAEAVDPPFADAA